MSGCLSFVCLISVCMSIHQSVCMSVRMILSKFIFSFLRQSVCSSACLLFWDTYSPSTTTYQITYAYSCCISYRHYRTCLEICSLERTPQVLYILTFNCLSIIRLGLVSSNFKQRYRDRIMDKILIFSHLIVWCLPLIGD